MVYAVTISGIASFLGSAVASVLVRTLRGKFVHFCGSDE